MYGINMMEIIFAEKKQNVKKMKKSQKVQKNVQVVAKVLNNINKMMNVQNIVLENMHSHMMILILYVILHVHLKYMIKNNNLKNVYKRIINVLINNYNLNILKIDCNVYINVVNH